MFDGHLPDSAEALGRGFKEAIKQLSNLGAEAQIGIAHYRRTYVTVLVNVARIHRADAIGEFDFVYWTHHLRTIGLSRRQHRFKSGWGRHNKNKGLQELTVTLFVLLVAYW